MGLRIIDRVWEERNKLSGLKSALPRVEMSEDVWESSDYRLEHLLLYHQIESFTVVHTEMCV